MDWAHVAAALNEHVSTTPNQVVILSHGIIKQEDVLESRIRRLCKLNQLDANETIVVATFIDGCPDPYRLAGTTTGVRSFARLMRDEPLRWSTDAQRLHQLSTRGCHLEICYDDGHQILIPSIPKHDRSCLEILGLWAPSPIKQLRKPLFSIVSKAMMALTITAATIISNSVR